MKDRLIEPLTAMILALVAIAASACVSDLEPEADASVPVDSETSPTDVGDPSWPSCPPSWPPSPTIEYCGGVSDVSCYEMRLDGVLVGSDGRLTPMLPCRGPGEIVLFPGSERCSACARILEVQ